MGRLESGILDELQPCLAVRGHGGGAILEKCSNSKPGQTTRNGLILGRNGLPWQPLRVP